MRKHAPVWVRSSGARLRPVRAYRHLADLQKKSRDEVLDLLENWKIGHSLAMQFFQLSSIGALTELMEANGRTMPGHQLMAVTKETSDLLKRITKPLPKQAAE